MNIFLCNKNKICEIYKDKQQRIPQDKLVEYLYHSQYRILPQECAENGPQQTGTAFRFFRVFQLDVPSSAKYMHYYNFYAENDTKENSEIFPLLSSSFFFLVYVHNFDTHFSNRSPSSFDRSIFRGSNKSSVSKAFLYPVLNKLIVHLIRNNLCKLNIRYTLLLSNELCNDANATVSELRDQK